MTARPSPSDWPSEFLAEDANGRMLTFDTRQIQEQSLRTYLFTYAPYYDSLSFDLLAQTFSLPRRSVVAIASKMIWSDELPASLDQIDGVIVFNRTEQTRVQQLAQELANKVREPLVVWSSTQLTVRL